MWRRSPHGERGLKCDTGLDKKTVYSRSPHGERGLKYVLIRWYVKGCMRVALLTESVDWNLDYAVFKLNYDTSLSSRRAWIEIPDFSFNCKYLPVALLTESVDWNASKLKQARKNTGSLSSRRAWIEIRWQGDVKTCNVSLSSRRAWIEIKAQFGHYYLYRSLSSRRAWIEIQLTILQYFCYRVALLTESVDWNWKRNSNNC